MFRKVLRIRAEDSPNVRLGLIQKAAGKRPTNEALLPGLLTWLEYCQRRGFDPQTGLLRPEPNGAWDPVRQCIGLDGLFYKGADVLLYPQEWLNLAEQLSFVRICKSSPTEAIGVDPAEGGDKTALAAGNKWGVKELLSVRTPDTNIIPGIVLAFATRHNVHPSKVMFDRGGGGKQHADRLKARGGEWAQVRSVGFGESPTLEPRRGMTLIEERKEKREERIAYKNLRAEMYWRLRERIDPSLQDPEICRGLGLNPLPTFALPMEFAELRRQMAPIPLLYDEEEQFYLPPKHRKNREPGAREQPNELTMEKLVGCSPDELDAVVLMLHAMATKPRVSRAGIVA